MLTKLSKILTIFVAMGSLTFMGFAISLYAGGQNWMAEINSPDLEDYIFTNSGGDEPTWKVERKGADAGQVGSDPSLPVMLTKAREDLRSKQQARITKLNEDAGKLIALAETNDKFNAADTKVLEQYIAQLETEADAFDVQIKDLSDKLTLSSQRTTSIREEEARRGEDVVRLQNELEVLRTDVFRLTELRKTLTDQLVRLKISNDALVDRRDQLDGE